MDDTFEAPPPENSRPRVDFARELSRVLDRGLAGENIEPLLEQLQERAEGEGDELLLADAYAAALGTPRVDDLPLAARLEVYLHTAWLCGGYDAHAATTLLAATSALDLAPADERALALAEPLLLEDEQYGELANRYAIAATSADNETRARQLLERALHMLGDVPQAAAAVLGLTERLARLSDLRDGDEALLSIVRSGAAADAETALVKLGERWLSEGRAREGVAQLVGANAERLEGEAALDILERLYDQTEDGPSLEQVLCRRVTLQGSPLGKARALERLATFYREFRHSDPDATRAFSKAARAYLAAGELDDAERAYERLLDVSPDDRAAATELVRLRAKLCNFSGVADAFSVVLRDSDDGFAAELLLSIADDAARAGAVDEFAELADNVSWRAAGDTSQLTAPLLRKCAELFTLSDRYDEAAELYRRLVAAEPTSRDVDAYQALIDGSSSSEWRQTQQRWLFEWQEHHSSDRPTVLLSWARFEERELGDPAAALEVLARAAALAPDRADIWEDLARLRLSEGDAEGGLVAASELRRLGRDVDVSLLCLLLEHDPGARWAIDRVKLTLSAEQRWPELFQLYERAIDATAGVAERARLLDEAAIAARDVVQDRVRAISYWERHTELVGATPRVDSALERLYEQVDDKQALLAHLERRLAALPQAERAPVELRIAQLSLQVFALGRALEAIESLGGCSNVEVVPLLERLVEQSAVRWQEDAQRAAGQRAAALLCRHYADLGQHEETARLLRGELSRALPREDRRGLLSQLSQLCERSLDDLDGAFHAARELFLVARGERERKRLEKLTKKLERWGELCSTYVEAARGATTPDERRELFRLAGDVAVSRLHDTSLAVRLARELFEVEPGRAVQIFEQLELDGGDTPETFEALCQLLHEARRFDELETVLVRASETRPTPELFSRLGRLQADELGKIPLAIKSHLAASDVRAAAEVFLRKPSVFGDDPERVKDLARRLVAVGLPEGAERVLRHQLAFYGSQYSSERKELHLELVSVLEEAGHEDAAREELAETAKRYPTDAQVQLTSARAAVGAEDWDRAEQYYRTLLLLLHGGNERAVARSRVYVELAMIKRKRGEPAAATELVDSAFEIALGDHDELVALAEGLVHYEQWSAAERALDELLGLAAEWPRSAYVLVALASLCAQSYQPSIALLERAASAARTAAARAAELPNDELRSRVLAASLTLLPLREAEELLEGRANELLPEDSLRARIDLGRRLLETGEPSVRSRAVGLLETLASHPQVPTKAWELLARAYEADGRSEKLYDALQAWLAREPTSVPVLSRTLQLQLQLGDVERSLSTFDRLSQLGATLEPELGRSLCKLCVDAGKVGRAVALLVADAEREKQPQKRAHLLVEAARLLFEQGQKAQARELALRAQGLDPGSADAVWLAAQVALGLGERPEALQLLTEHLDSKERRRGKPLARVLRLAADLHLANDELSEALPLLTEAHQLDKTDLDTALLLGLLAIDLDRLETAASALRVLIAQRELGTREGAAARSFQLAQAYYHLARIDHHHGKKTNAKRMALRALEENPHYAAAAQLLATLGMH